MFMWSVPSFAIILRTARDMAGGPAKIVRLRKKSARLEEKSEKSKKVRNM
jgi:hypothetical protein